VIGTSLGQLFKSEADMHMAPLKGEDNNVIDPETTPDIGTDDQNIVTPDTIQPKDQSLIIPAADIKTSSPFVTITDNDIDKAIGIGMAFSGGGLSTSAAEKVKSAALQYKGQTYEGLNHGYALGDIMDKFGDIAMKDIKDGFTTTHGRFVSREEAFDLAKGQGQIHQKVLDSIPEHQDYNMLLSEDINDLAHKSVDLSK
jgi:hypothetical protein